MTSLEYRRKQYDIPETPYLPIGKNVLVFRLPMEQKTAGGLFIAESAQQAKRQGVLVAAGLRALEIFSDHLVALGDVVYFGRYAGDEDEFKRDPEGKGKRIIEMKCEDINGSVDALERVTAYDIAPNEEGDLVYTKRAAANDNALAQQYANTRRGAP